jgi:hypothetical protein
MDITIFEYLFIGVPLYFVMMGLLTFFLPVKDRTDDETTS